MKVYKYFITLGNEETARSWATSHKDIKLLNPYYLGFYQERGSYAEPDLSVPWPGLYFNYVGPEDMFELVSCARDIESASGTLDLLCWKDIRDPRTKWSLAEYLGLAHRLGKNLYKISV